MRVIEFDGQRFKITGQQRRSLLNRFDVKKARKVEGEWKINLSCVMCKNTLCSRCVFDDYGCGRLLREAGSSALALAVYDSCIMWSRSNDAEVRRGIRGIRELLLSAKKE